MNTLILACLAGFCLAATPGPMAVLVTQRTLRRGFAAGARTGFGIATGDALWTCLAALAWGHVAVLLHTSWACRLAGLGLWVIAAQLWHVEAPSAAVGDGGVRGGRADFWSALFCTLASPLTIASMAAVMAAFGPHVVPLPFVVGIAAGSLLWWLLLSMGVAWGRRCITPRQTLWLSRGSAVLLALLGVRCFWL